MDLDELQSVQSRERQTDSLQQLRESFYRDAADYIQQLREERERAADEADDPWNSPEVTRLSDDIDTAEGTVEAIYERRVGKIVKMASLAAADMPTEDEGLTDEERLLFETLVESIERNRDRVFAILDGEDPADLPGLGDGAPVPDTEPAARESASGEAAGTPDAASPAKESAAEAADDRPIPEDVQSPESLAGDPEDGIAADADAGDSPTSPAGDGEPAVDAADLMGDSDGGSDLDGGDREVPPEPGEPGGAPAAGEPSADEVEGAASTTADGAEDETADAAAVDRATVRITADVGEIYGVDQRAYDLTEEDVVTLPEANAGPLVERDAAERLD